MASLCTRHQLRRRRQDDDLTGGFSDTLTVGSFMMRLASATQLAQMNTRGPATSFETSAALLPQNEQASLGRTNMTHPPQQQANATFASMPPNGTKLTGRSAGAQRCR